MSLPPARVDPASLRSLLVVDTDEPGTDLALHLNVLARILDAHGGREEAGRS